MELVPNTTAISIETLSSVGKLPPVSVLALAVLEHDPEKWKPVFG
jgi:hypothetical protein